MMLYINGVLSENSVYESGHFPFSRAKTGKSPE